MTLPSISPARRPRPFAAWTSLAVAAVLAGCASSPMPAAPPPVETRPAAPAPSSAPGATAGAGTAPAPQSQVATVDLAARDAAAAAAAANAAGRVVYFDFDSFAIKDEFKPLVEAHARALVANKNQRLAIEGHTDERGGREYNLALGQKRAEAVLRSMVLLGAADGQVEAVSFGEERPAAQGSDESAWSRNRRAELRSR